MNRSTDDEATSRIETRSHEVFADSLTHLDGTTRSRLTQARHAALDALAPQSSALRWLLPAGSVAALALMTVVAVQLLRPSPAVMTTASTVDDIEIMTSPDSLELIEDADFYAWLDTVEGAALPGDNKGERG